MQIEPGSICVGSFAALHMSSGWQKEQWFSGCQSSAVNVCAPCSAAYAIHAFIGSMMSAEPSTRSEPASIQPADLSGQRKSLLLASHK